MELNALTLGALVVAFVAGGLIGCEQTPIEVQPEPNEQDAIAPPRDYADARGQLQ